MLPSNHPGVPVKFCSACGYSNQPEARACTRCGFVFAVPLRARHSSGIPLLLLLGVILSGMTAAIAARVMLDRRQVNEVRSRFAGELRRLDDIHEKEFQAKREEEAQRARAEETAHRTRLQDSALVSGELARANHASEWRKRLAHDPEFAHSALERTILKMQKVGGDPSLAAREALDEVARLAAPPGSRVEVTNAYDKFAVRVAFKMSALSRAEAGLGTKHRSIESMRRETREASAAVIRELFDYCGARGIARLSVSCNHAVYRHGYIPGAATEAERKELEKRGAVMMACLYRVTIDASQAMGVGSWRAISIPQVMQIMRVDYDAMTGLKLGDLPADLPWKEDPEMELEF
jgi:hypothetical protein